MTTNNSNLEAYRLAQHAIADLKSAILIVLNNRPEPGLRNVDIGKTLGIYAGHAGHEGHIPRVLLAALENDGVVKQNEDTKLWSIQFHGEHQLPQP